MLAKTDFESRIRDVIAKATGTNADSVILERPKESRHGDYAYPCFGLAKEQKKSPVSIAAELKEKISSDITERVLISKVACMGPYLNFFVNKAAMAKSLILEALKRSDLFGSSKPAKKERIMVEYSAPNANKPQHLGHIRNNVLGMAISNILEFAGHKVIRVNWINDRGIAMCKVILAYDRWGNERTPKDAGRKPDHFVGDYYVLYQQEASKDESLDEEAQQLVQRWEAGDRQVRRTWKRLVSWIDEGYAATYKELGCAFDHVFWESDIYTDAKNVIDEGLKKGVFEKDDEGAVIARLGQYGLPDKVLMRADGTSIYVTADIALAREKDRYRINRSLYVVGSEQQLYFRQLFRILELLGLSYAKNCMHVSYGLVYLPEGKMKSREGKIVEADDMIKEMIELAAAEVRKRDDTIGSTELESRARAIGIGALKFYMLRNDHVKDVHYDPRESISFEGETGPYVQYAFARIMSIFRKRGMAKKGMAKKGTAFSHAAGLAKKADCSLLTTEQEKALISQLGTFEEVIADAATHYRPHVIARHLLVTAQLFSEYYHKEPILKAEEALQKARLSLIAAIAVVMKNGLRLLGIDAVERM